MQITAELHDFPDRDSWLAARRELGIGSSDVPAILGLSRYASPLSLYSEKIGLVTPSVRYAESARWGQILEEPIAQRYREEVGRILAPARPFHLYRSLKYPHATASIDRFICGIVGDLEVNPTAKVVLPPGPGYPGVLEIKNAHWVMRDMWSEENNNEPPVEYQVQLQHQLAVTDLAWGSIAAVIGGCEFKWADIKRDDALIESIEAAVAEFWRRVELRDPPPADGLEPTRDVLKQLYPKDNGSSLQLPPEAVDWHFALEEAKAREKAAKADRDIYENKLRQAIGEHTAGVLVNGGLYTNRLQQRSGYTVEPAEFRVLRFSKGKK